MANEDERAPRARRGGPSRLPSFLYGAALLALGACLGVVIGSLSETPRLLLERLRGPVETVDLAASESGPSEEEDGPAVLERFGELQEGKAPRKAPPPARAARPAPPAPAPPPAAPAPAAPAPAKAERAESAPGASAPAVSSRKAPAAAAEVAPPARAPAPGSSVVQVASYIDKKQAEELAAKLREIGFDSYVSQPAAQNGRYRVRIRPGPGEAAPALATRLKGFGFDTWATSE